MDRKNVGDCNTELQYLGVRSPHFLFSSVISGPVIFSPRVTQHSSKVQIMTFLMKIDFVFFCIFIFI